jgi:hypothetical protein
VNVSSILAGEYAENLVRKDFTPSERVAIARAVERQVGNRRGQRTDQLRGKIPEVAPGKRTREAAAERAGFGNDKTYRQAAKVVANGTPRLNPRRRTMRLPEAKIKEALVHPERLVRQEAVQWEGLRSSVPRRRWYAL